MITLEHKYKVTLEAAVEASKIIMEVYENDFDTIIKDDGSPLTKADLASTKIIHKHLEPLNIPITGEETDKLPFSERKTWKECWCVDPLDGTKEFIKKNGEFAVNIALLRDGKAVFGLIASPVQKIMYVGGSETGVYKIAFKDIYFSENWEALSAPVQVNDPMVMTCSRSHHSSAVLNFINELKKISPTIEFAKKGSSLKFFDLASGTADAYPRFAPTMEWDIAAGQAILEALGGSVVRADTGVPLNYNKENLTNPYFIAKTKPLLALS
ncbi:MAG: 3'(2'),5'-bisphosphate nucleotidase CysQ [Crocinitomicaceae bacterium]|tara:strand:- start:7409 stop:8215 length:807 start_codon:yes stop_codon:yes gene_type:complete